MKLLGLDGKTYSLNLSQYQGSLNSTNKSQYHLKARELIRELYPRNPIYEEILLPGGRSAGSMLYADFFIPTQMMLVEVHGEQHYSDNTFFYKTKLDFILAQQRDRKKAEWCEMNSYKYVELSYKETIDEWREKLR